MASYLVKLLKKGGEKIGKRISKNEAIRSRSANKGLNVVSDTQAEAKRIERAARQGDTKYIKRHKGHPQPDGSVGFPHYQTKKVPGHSAWLGSKGKILGIVGAIITFLDPLDAISGDLYDDENYEIYMINQYYSDRQEGNCDAYQF